MVEHIIDLSDLSIKELNKVIKLALEIKKSPSRYSEALKGKVLATLFYEPSTRTQMSFQTAMLRLGGSVIGFDNPGNSSVAKGENLKDTIKIISGYADIIAMRHPMEGSAKAAALFSDAPVINGGDGGHLHPTQTLTDIVTLYSEKSRLTDLTIGLCGDLKNGRTVHSLIKTMSQYENNRFVLISTRELSVPGYIKDIMDSRGCEYTEINSLKEAMPLLDVLYMTRIQQERFSSPEEYERQRGVFVLDCAKMKLGKKDLCVLHPLPRVDEIETEVDDDPRAMYFKQAVYGMYARMALFITMLSDENKTDLQKSDEIKTHRCANSKCITSTEKYLPSYLSNSGDMLICDFCEDRQLV